MCPPSHPTTPTLWRALEPAAAPHIMSAVDAPWWIAGGWAIDLFVGTQTRAHKDLDLGVRRADAARIIAALPAWEFFEVKDGVLSRLALGTEPRAVVNSLWGRRVGEAHWEFELLLDDASLLRILSATPEIVDIFVERLDKNALQLQNDVSRLHRHGLLRYFAQSPDPRRAERAEER